MTCYVYCCQHRRSSPPLPSLSLSLSIYLSLSLSIYLSIYLSLSFFLSLSLSISFFFFISIALSLKFLLSLSFPYTCFFPLTVFPLFYPSPATLLFLSVIPPFYLPISLSLQQSVISVTSQASFPHHRNNYEDLNQSTHSLFITGKL